MATKILKEPPEKGDPQTKHNQNTFLGPELQQPVSFHDKVLGKYVPPPRDKVDLMAKKLDRAEYVNGNRLMPMLHVEKKVLEELSVPWKDALVVKLLGKSMGFNVMKARLALTWKLYGGFEIMDVGNGYYMAKFVFEEDKSKVIT